MKLGSQQNDVQYRIVTCADSGFYHFLPTLEQNVRRKTGRFPIVYDLGLTKKQRKALKSELIQIDPPKEYGLKTSTGNIKATHKPTCLLDFLNRSTEDCLYIDADVVIIDRVEIGEFDRADIAVTPRHPNEMRSADPYLNGKVNTGVIFLRNMNAVRDFVVSWIAQCRTGDCSDQQALTEILPDAGLTDGLGLGQQGSLQVLKLDARIYNDVSSTIGKLWHFKNAGRRFHKRRKWYFSTWLEKIAPNWLSYRTAQRRSTALAQQ